MSKKIASIDIGTNTILMSIGDSDSGNNLRILSDHHEIARLGEGVDNSGNISGDAISRASDILNKYRFICQETNVDSIHAVATSALRDASNKEHVLSILNHSLNSEIKVISGKDEAEYSFLGTVENNLPSTVIDIGGGSTEFIYGSNSVVEHSNSLQIGSVRLTERFQLIHPLDTQKIFSVREFISSYLKSNLNQNDFSGNLYAVAGTPTTLAAMHLNLSDYDRVKVHGYKLTLTNLIGLLEKLTRSTLVEITNNYKINPKRADVITAGTMILIEALIFLGQDNCIVSANGLRIGLLKKSVLSS